MIEVQIPGRSNQSYPEPVLRTLIAEGKLEPEWAARAVGAPSWSTVGAILNAVPPKSERASVSAPPPAQAAASGLRGGFPFEVSLTKRYQHSQALVSGLEAEANFLENLGMIAAILITLTFLAVPSMVFHSADQAVPGTVTGAIIGFIVYRLLKARATLLRLQASLLAAAIDTAIYACPYLSDAARLKLILPDEA